MAGPLAGIRALDFTHAQQGPQSTLMLADMGAEVIKVEEPTQGERGRATHILKDLGISAYFLAHNRGKKSIAVNLKAPQAREIILKLASRCDVVVSNFRPGVMEKLGLGYQDFRQVNPRIVYATASGWGRQGPRRHHPGLDIGGQAMSGLMSVTGEKEGGPLPTGAAIADHGGAMHLAMGILAALLARERSGQGQELDVSLLGSAIHAQSWEMTYYLLSGKAPPRAGRGHPYTSATTIWRTFPTADGHLVIGGVRDREWPAFCRALGIEQLEDDPRFATAKARQQNHEVVFAILDEVFPTRTTAQWCEALAQADQVFAPVLTYEQVAREPQVLANEYITEVDHPSLGRIPVVGHPIRFSETPAQVAAAAPGLGQHTEAVLLELGYTWDDLIQMREQGVFGEGAQVASDVPERR